MAFLSIRTLAWTASAAALVIGSGEAQAQNRPVYKFNLPEQDLADALVAISRTSGREVIFPMDLVRGHRAPALARAATADEAIEALLAGSNLEPQFRPDVVLIRRRKSTGESAPSNRDRADIVVTGSRIAGAAVAAPVITISQGQMRQAGQTDLGDVVRSIPQNFSGGQNPGVASGASSSNVNNANATGGSSINLRGLGPDATLTLLNGRRLSYGSFSQAVDVSSIPLAAVERIEIVADGASAIYGSDAVAGVANIILKPDYDGIATSARLGAATDGGNFQQQYNLVAGARWVSGGIIATYDFERDTAIEASQREYTGYVLSPQTILPSLKRHSAVASAHQQLSEGVRLSIDGLYNRRWSYSVQTLTSSINHTDRAAENWVISPALSVNFPARWSMTLSGTYGKDDVILDQPSFTRAGVQRSRTRNCYCNAVKSAELDVGATVLDLPGGAVRLATGVGYRENIFDQRSLTSATRVMGRQGSSFAFGELFVPVVAPSQHVALVDHLSLTGAVRHENYSTFGGITTPKFGIIYAPVPGLELKGSWGRSFKAPTLLQQNSPAFALLFPAASLGATGVPSQATALVGFGGNPELRPERATSWSTTMSFRPIFAPGLIADISYFNVRYRDRVVEAVGNLFSAFGTPAYAEFLSFNPTPAQQQAVIDRAGTMNFINYTGRTYNPANVVAIVNDYYTNAAVQRFSGIDIYASYQADIGRSSVTLIGQASRIESRQKNSELSTYYDLAGTAFNPPTFRTRVGFTLEEGAFTFSPFVNYFGGVRDTRSASVRNGASMATIDMTLMYDFSTQDGLMRDLGMALVIRNVANERPPYLRNTSTSVVNYDSTNYSAIGRFVSLTIRKGW
ncbi:MULTISPECIES: TonB-dependent receptor domain-containing protein [unclassified Sphingomonas]|uniref:TonB-dependent receptor plug domain-containing protein n=1 Tax=unclassified Sphingomonas TaxID=196159 RepID=UPI00285CFB5C|nr:MULTISPECIES: TonB-dependent receptor [unclassified Sphingomonas]MDR6116616.1 iron complex outermembrane receptor protein [Sphingomonas sp. SORGH_AS_0789]MDR6149707.1 iron complex outermembrane receptor protein [Sphingomonas sp. SORGH_AS_0742]